MNKTEFRPGVKFVLLDEHDNPLKNNTDSAWFAIAKSIARADARRLIEEQPAKQRDDKVV